MKVRLKKAVAAPVPPKPAKRRVLNRGNCDPTKQLLISEVVLRVVALAQTLKEKQFYPYQVELASRIVESLLEHDGETITALLSRQSGKTETMGAIVAAILIIFPSLAKQFPDDWHFNITDDNGVYRGFSFGVKIGIYAPRLDQAGIMFERVRQALESDTAKKVLRELNISIEVCNGNTVRLSNGGRVLCESASEQSKIEGETHNLLVCEEAQDIGDMKMKKSLHPMVSATGGTIVKVGTATTQKCDFYTAIKQNERTQVVTGVRNHFFFPYTVTQEYNSLYKSNIEKEKLRLGEDSDEFRTSYCAEWIFERGMFLTQEQLFNVRVAATAGMFANRMPRGFPPRTMTNLSLVVGIDWGSSNDSTVLTTMAVDWNNPVEAGETSNSTGMYHYEYFQKHVLDWLEFIGDNYEYQFANVMEHLRGIRNLKKIVTDSNGCGKPLFDRLTAVLAGTGVIVEDFNFQPRLKSDGFKSLYSDVCGQRLTFPASESARQTIQYRKFINQMLDLRKTYKNQLMQVAHPEERDAHDDYASSLMLAAWGANTPANSTTLEFLDNNVFIN